jgi:hypothetical protein
MSSLVVQKQYCQLLVPCETCLKDSGGKYLKTEI